MILFNIKYYGIYELLMNCYYVHKYVIKPEQYYKNHSFIFTQFILPENYFLI